MQTPTKSKKIKKNSVAVDFHSVSLSSLKKYRRQYQIRVKPTAPKAELATAIAEHFASIPVPGEEDAISGFLQAVQKNRQARLIEEEQAAAAAAASSQDSSTSTTSSPIKSKSKKQVERLPSAPIKNISQSNSKKAKREKARS